MLKKLVWAALAGAVALGCASQAAAATFITIGFDIAAGSAWSQVTGSGMPLHIALWAVAILALGSGPLLIVWSAMDAPVGRSRPAMPTESRSDEILFIAGWALVLIGAVCLKLA